MKDVLYRQRRYLAATVIIFISGFLIGTSLPFVYAPEQGSPQGEIFNNVSLSFVDLLINNGSAALQLIGGALSGGIMTVYNLLLNGFILGVVFHSAIRQQTVIRFFVFILPHGIFEISGFCFAGAAGLKLPYGFIQYLREKNDVILTSQARQDVATLCLGSLVLIVLAAFIESQITTGLAEMLL